MRFAPNLFDRALSFVAPGAALRNVRERGQFKALADLGSSIDRQMLASDADEGPYATTGGGAGGWFRRWMPLPRDAAADTLPHARTLRGQSRDLVRKEPYAVSALHTKANRAVGTGLALSAQPQRLILGWTEEQAREWRQRTHAEFSLWADSPTNCDYFGQQSFYELQWLAEFAMSESGDSFSNLPDGKATPYKLRIQVIEADRVGNPQGAFDTPGVAGGIKRGVGGEPTQYYLYDKHPGAGLIAGATTSGEWRKAFGETGRWHFLHHYMPTRPEQPRGIPDLTPVMGLFKQLGRYTDAEIKAAIVHSFLALLVKTDITPGGPPIYDGTVVQAPADGSPAAPAQMPQRPIELGPAMALQFAPGETPELVSPNRPNTAFGNFVQSIIDQLGAGILIGPEMLAKKYNTSYVAARAAFLDAWTHLRMVRRKIALSFCQPIYETWLAEAVAIGRIKAPGFWRDPLLRWAYTRALWSGDSQGSINPKDEVKAYNDAIEARLITRERAQWELYGDSYEESYDTKKAEHDRLKADGMLPVSKSAAPAQKSDKQEEAAQQ